MAVTLTDELQRIAAAVRVIVLNPALRPDIAPRELLEGALAYPLAGGKALRPTLLTLACRALGGPEAAAIQAGAAVELYHTYTLVHDDIIDRDAMRRGKPSVHALMSRAGGEQYRLPESEAAHYGLSMAILTGDAQQCWAIDLLASLTELDIDAAIVLQLIRRLQGVVGPAIVQGEALDIQLPFLPIAEVTPEMIQRVILTKTAALFKYCAWAGGMLAVGQDTPAVRALSVFAEQAGIAFQLQDDVMGVIGNEAKLGKPVGSDLREGKRTLILALAWEHASGAERELLSSVLGDAHAPATAISAVTALLQRLGAIDAVQTMANRYLERALQHLATLPDNAEIALLREMALLMVQREK
jgi:geranylgeranyl diphosphate synthase type I